MKNTGEDKPLSNLKKATVILQILGKSPYSFTAAEISALSGINRTTVYRILTILSGDNFVIQDPITRKFTVGPMLYHVGSVYINSFRFRNEIYRMVEKVADETGESAGFAVREGNNIISLYEVENRQPFKMNHPAGSFYPMNRGCYGKCLMAYHDRDTVRSLLAEQRFEKLFPNTLTDPEEILREYDRIRSKGFVVSDGESYGTAAAGVGVPICNPSGVVRACMAVAFIKGPDFEEKKERFLPILKTCAEELSRFIP